MIKIFTIYFVSIIIIYELLSITIKLINKRDNENICNSKIIKICISTFVSLITLIIYLKFQMTSDFLIYFILIIYVTLNGYIDFCTRYIYDFMSIVFIIAGALVNIYRFINGDIKITNILYAALFMFIVYIFSKLKFIGTGDVEVFLVTVLFLNKNIILPFINLILSFSISGIIGIALLIMKKAKIHSRIPFGPSIAISIYTILILVA